MSAYCGCCSLPKLFLYIKSIFIRLSSCHFNIHNPLMLNVSSVVEVAAGAVTGGLVIDFKDRVSAQLASSYLLCLIKLRIKLGIFKNNFKHFLLHSFSLHQTK